MAKQHVNLVDDEEEGDSILEYSENIAEAKAPEPLPEREYIATVSKVTRELSERTGFPYVQPVFHIAEEEYPIDFDASNAPGGKDIRHVVGIADDPVQRYRMRKFCEAIGAPMSKRINFNEWIGLQARITLKHETYEGVKREKIGKVDSV